jgi:decaprenylphospho-beta-D-erythro-pentofuranosid-2-ulose 2-reductase
MKRVLIIGATSAIAEATGRRFARNGAELYLLARDEERLEDLAKDFRIRGAASVGCAVLDVNAFDSHERALDRAVGELGELDVALIAHGTLGDQAACERSFERTLRELNTNAISVISLLTHLANYFEKQGRGTIAVISSVAGDRGRQSNYVYGTAKGAVSVFLQGLRNRLYKSGVHVLTIKPGLVDTPMTAHLEKGILWATPETVARGIERAIEKQKCEAYLPARWFLIMRVVGWIPERLFRRLSF